MKINHNIAALNAYRNLAVNNNNTAKSLEKLSSGLRINRASDDAAGLAISEKMRSQIRGLEMAERNTLDGISFVQTAEGALSSVHSMLQRMRELAVQAANDSNTEVDRNSIQQEINQLTNEINRISNATEFNTKKLLDGSLSNEATTIITGSGTAASLTGQTAVDLTTDLSGLTLNPGTSVGITVGTTTYKLDQTALSSLDGTQVESDLVSLIENAVDGLGNSLMDAANVTITGGKITITSKDIGTDSQVLFSITDSSVGTVDTGKIVAALGINDASSSTGTGTQGIYEIQFKPKDITIDGQTFTYSDTPASGKWSNVNELQALIAADPILNQVYTASVFDGKILLTQKAGKESATAPTIDSNSLVKLQIGANQGQTVSLELKNMQSAAIGISRATVADANLDGSHDIILSTGEKLKVWYTPTKQANNGVSDILIEHTVDVSNHEKASAAITVFEDAITRVSAERSRLGAIQNRLEHTTDNLKYMTENVTAAESRIRDLDMAMEMSTYTKNNILVQSAQAMLAQANQLPQGVLQLLK